jgi:glycosyltransferase involved in cell wall biosynthesis
MRIAFEHKGILPVVKYGGIERILFWHMKELAKRGHEVTLFGHPESKVKEYGIKLVPIEGDAKKTLDTLTKDQFDIIHLTYNYEPKSEVPVLINMQCNGQIGEKFSKNSIFVSKKHAKNHGSEHFIYNALDFDEYPYEPRPENELNSFLFLAKGSWSVKNLKHCISVCKKAKKHLHIAGGRSLMPSRFIHSHGMVGGDEKINVMKKCDAFLFPVRWHEPFGIAIIEAMAMGMPVLGGPYGSLPELITKETGVVCNNKSELLTAVSENKNKFNKDTIRKYVEDNFSISRLTDQYLAYYERVIAGETLHEENPTWQLDQAPEELLDF